MNGNGTARIHLKLRKANYKTLFAQTQFDLRNTCSLGADHTRTELFNIVLIIAINNFVLM